MTIFLQVLATFLAAVAMAFALAHAAGPGKMRLGKEAYLTVQPIYSPGFTVGAIAEPAAIVATLGLLVASGSRPCSPRSWPSSRCTASTGWSRTR
jgi:hypothetical protein